MNKIGHPNFLSNEKESLIVTSADIEGVHGPPLDSNSLLGELQHYVKSFQFWCGDNDILDNFTLQVFLPSCQLCQLKG